MHILDRTDPLHHRCASLRELLPRRTQILYREGSEDVASVIPEGEPSHRLYSLSRISSFCDDQVPETIRIDFNTPLFHSLEEEGVEELRHAGFVLVSYLGFYVKKILAIQVRFDVVPHEASCGG